MHAHTYVCARMCVVHVCVRVCVCLRALAVRTWLYRYMHGARGDNKLVFGLRRALEICCDQLISTFVTNFVAVLTLVTTSFIVPHGCNRNFLDIF
jgi:hypothetical protein